MTDSFHLFSGLMIVVHEYHSIDQYSVLGTQYSRLCSVEMICSIIVWVDFELLSILAVRNDESEHCSTLFVLLAPSACAWCLGAAGGWHSCGGTVVLQLSMRLALGVTLPGLVPFLGWSMWELLLSCQAAF